MADCPLERYLAEHELSVVAFCGEGGFAPRTIYDLLNGVPKDYSLSTLNKIEVATRGEVTLSQLADWIDRAKNYEIKAEKRAYRPHRA